MHLPSIRGFRYLAPPPTVSIPNAIDTLLCHLFHLKQRSPPAAWETTSIPGCFVPCFTPAKWYATASLLAPWKAHGESVLAMLDEIKPAERTIIGGHSRFENFGCCINLSLKHYSLQVQCHTRKASLPANSLESDGRNALYSLRLTTRARPNSAISANTSEPCRNRSVGTFPHHVGDTERPSCRLRTNTALSYNPGSGLRRILHELLP